jgi:hypothetical protein
MANEIQVTTRLYAAKNGAVLPGSTHSWTANMSGVDMLSQTQSVGTTEESLSLGADVGAPYMLEIANLDSTNYIEVGVAAGVYFGRILAGQSLFIPYVASGVTVYLKANTAAVSIQTSACEV